MLLSQTELQTKLEHKAKMESNFVKFRYRNNSIKRKRSNNKHANGRQNRKSLQMEQEQQQSQQNLMYPQFDEFDMLALVNAKLLPSEAFVPQPQNYNQNDSTLLSLEQWNQSVPFNFDMLNPSPQICPVFPLTNLQSSSSQNTFSPLNHTVDPILNDITALSLNDPYVNHFPTLNQPTEPVLINSIPTPINTEQNSSQLQESNMPSRPDPPQFKDGPLYVRASDDFIDYFKTIDVDDSGTISFIELKGYLFNKGENRHQNFNDRAVHILIEMFDKNNDGTIDKEEFPELLAFIRNWEQCFLFLDTDKSGTINYQEMHIAIQALGLRDFGAQCLAKLLYQYDPTGREIDFDNFILICVSVVRFNETFKFMQKTFGTHGICGLTLEDLITACGKRML